MDDYPRAPILTTKEAHLDLQVWMIVSTNCLAKIATLLGKDADATKYTQLKTEYTDALEANFWDESREIYDEFYYDSNGQKQFDGHSGYLNYWPVFLDLDVDAVNNERLRSVALKMIDRDNGIWTKYGLRSLSDKDPDFKLGDNYWTSPIWLNINYLIAAGLKRYADSESLDDSFRAQMRDAYGELR